MADTNQRVGIEFDVEKTGEVDAAADLRDQIGGLKQSLDAAGQASDLATAAMLNGFRNIERPLTNQRVLLSDLKRQIDAIRAGGGVVSDEDLKRLERLEQDYQRAVTATGQYRSAQQQVNRELQDATINAGGAARQINSLGDIVGQLADDIGPAAIKWTTWSTAAVGALTAGYAAGLKAKEGFNWLTDGEFDRNVQASIAPLVNLFAPALDTSAEKAQLLRNQLNILRSNGIDPVGLSAAQVQQKVDELGKGMLTASEDAQKGAAKIKEWAKALPSKDELAAEATALAATIEAFQRTNNLKPPQLAALFGQEIQGVLNALERGGLAIPAALQGWTTALGILPTSLDKIRSEVEKRIAELAKTFGFKPEQVLTVEQRVNEINAALEKLGHTPTGDAAKAFHDQVQALVNEVRAAHGQLDPELQKLADKAGVVTAAYERIGDSSIVVAQGAHETAAAFEHQINALSGTGEATKHFADGMKESAKASDEVKDKSGSANTALHDLGETAKVAGGKTATAAEDFKKPALAAATSKEALQTISDQMELIARHSGEAGSKLPTAAAGLDKIAPAAAAAKTALGDIGTVDFSGPLLAQVAQVVAAITGLPQIFAGVVGQFGSMLGGGGDATGGATGNSGGGGGGGF